jgi:GNAT superfamily N-acetyltransferase
MGLMAPRFQAELVGEALVETAEALIAHAVGAINGVTYIEAGTEAVPSEWSLAWQAALGRQRFKLVAESHEYVHQGTDVVEGLTERGPAVSLVSAKDLPDEQLESIYRQTYEDTPDGAHRQSLENYRSRLEALRHLPSLRHDPTLWFVAFERGRSVGLVLCAREASVGRIGWVLEVGVLPAWRGQGLGGHLLRQAVRRLGDRGCRVIKSRVDDANAPSIQMHLSNGFVPQPGVARLYQRRLPTI